MDDVDETRDEEITIGKIVSAVALRGEVKVYPYTEPKERFESLRQILLAQKGASRPVAVEHVRYQKNMVILKLAGVDDRTAAEALRDGEVRISAASLPPLPKDTYYVRDLIGCTVWAVEPAGAPGGPAAPADVTQGAANGPPTSSHADDEPAAPSATGAAARISGAAVAACQDDEPAAPFAPGSAAAGGRTDDALPGTAGGRVDDCPAGRASAVMHGVPLSSGSGPAAAAVAQAVEPAAPPPPRLIGEVTDVWQHTAQDIYVVRRPDGREALIPAVGDFVQRVDIAARRIYIRPIPGLIEE